MKLWAQSVSVSAFLCCAAVLLTSPVAALDRVFINGSLITLDPAHPYAQAIALSGNKIKSIGTNAEVLAQAAPNTQIIDLGGLTLIPGLIDSHIHAIRAGLNFSTNISFVDVPDLKIALARLHDAASQTQDQWLVVTGGWNIQQFAQQRRPSLAEIQSAAPGRAVYIQLAYHSVFISVEGLVQLGILSDADLPSGSHFEVDSGGQKTGWILGSGAAVVALYDRLPKQDIAKHIEGTKRFFTRLNQFGITGVSDPGGHNLAVQDYDALFQMAEHGALSLKMAFSAFAPRAGFEREDLERMARDFGQRATNPMLTFNGIGECVTWGFYNNDSPTAMQIAEFESVARWAAQTGQRLTIHWNNDASAPVLLDVFERINADYPLAPLRWSIAHVHDMTRPTLERMKALGVGWLVQDAGYFAAPSWLRAKGAALATTPQLATALRLGVHVGGGTDADRVMSYNPFIALRWLIDGVTIGGLSTRNSDELLSREDALRIYTQGSAWFSHDDNHRGMLAVGYDADLAVLDRDYLSVPLQELAATRSLLTLVDGGVVFADGPFVAVDSAPQ